MEGVPSCAPAKPDVRAGIPASIIPLDEILAFPIANIPTLSEKVRLAMQSSVDFHQQPLLDALNGLAYGRKLHPDTIREFCDKAGALSKIAEELRNAGNAIPASSQVPGTSSSSIGSSANLSSPPIGPGTSRQDLPNCTTKGSQAKRPGANLASPADKTARKDPDGFVTVSKRHSFRPATAVPSTSAASPVPTDQIGTDVDPDTVAAAMDITSEPRKEKKPPPVKILPDINWQVHVAAIKQFAPTAVSKLTGKFLSLSVATSDEFRSLTSYLDRHKIQNWTYLLDEDKPFKAVIRGLPAQTATEQIKIELELLGFQNVTVTQMYRGPRNRRVVMPLFLVQVTRTRDVAKIYEISELLGTQVQLEKYRGTKGPSQCHNCQYFWHSSVACKLHPRCVKCGGPHRTESCEKIAEDPCVCCNCGGSHPANYRKCPKFPKLKTKRALKRVSKPGERRVDAVPSGRQFESAPVSNSRSYARTASYEEDFPALPGKSIPKTTPPPSEDTTIADLLKQILVLESSYERKLILQAFKTALPAIKNASHPADQAYFLYESLVRLSP